MRPSDFNIQEIIDALVGTCNSFDSVLPEGMDWNDLTTADHEAIDNQIFNCDDCGWWCELVEQNSEEEGYCTDCRPDEED